MLSIPICSTENNLYIYNALKSKHIVTIKKLKYHEMKLPILISSKNI